MDLLKIVNDMSLEELAGQVLCYDISPKDNPDEVIEVINKIKPGGIFLTGMNKERISLYIDAVNRVTKAPAIVASDIENGPDTAVAGAGLFPNAMAWGACDDPDLIREAGSVTAKICRKNGVSWTYSPVVDINYNFRSP
ncbi:MAG: hypothetical protein J6V68_00090, partial [Clostridia bacterium]|nr:hypothetical protein [Clostridia bacterium]